jgi:hypothetical protein
MPRTDLELAQETKRWKNYLSDKEQIPLYKNKEYTDENDIYERLLGHVKNWIEGEFGYRTNSYGQLQPLSEKRRTQESRDLENVTDGYLTNIEDEWFEAALKGDKNLKDSIPHYSGGNFGNLSSGQAKRTEEIRKQAESTFFPAYRALKESFDSRSVFQWFSNHRQYIAERDALRVMANLIKSVTGLSERQINAAVKEQQRRISDSAVQAADVPPIKMASETQKSNDEQALEARANDIAREQVEKDKAPIPFSHKSVEPMMFFDPSYIPNINNLENENKLADQWQSVINQSDEFNKKGWFAKWRARNTPIAKLSKNLAKNPMAYSYFSRNLSILKEVSSQKEEDRIAYIQSKAIENKETNNLARSWNVGYSGLEFVDGLVTLDGLEGTVVTEEHHTERVQFNGEFKENEELSKSQRINEPPYKNKELDI